MSMKDLLSKMSQLEALAAPKAKKVLTEDSVSPAKVEATAKRSLKDIFNELHESIPAGAKPLPVMDPTNKKAGAGVVTSNNPAVQNLLKNLDPKDVQIVMTQQQPMQQTQQTQQKPVQQQQSGTTPAPAGATGQPQAGQMQMKEKDEGKPGKNFAKIAKSAGERYGSKAAGERVAGAVRAKLAKQGKLEEEELDEKFASKQQAKLMYATAGGADTGVSKKVAKEFIKKSHGQKVSRLPTKVKEGDIAPTSGQDTQGANLGAGRSKIRLEGKKPDFLDLDKDGNKKESMKKAASDKKKKAVKESMSHKINAARLEGKSHGLKGHAYCGKNYDDMDEARAYHDGFKEGLDECYGMGPIVGLIKKPRMPATTRSMANQALEEQPLEEVFSDDMEEGKLGKAALALGGAAALAAAGGMAKGAYDYHKKDPITQMSQSDMDLQRKGGFYNEDEMDEGNAFTAGLARAKKGEQFKVGGKTFTDRSNYDSKLGEGDFAFEALDRQLNALLNEGLSVSISKGNQSAPDSVNVNATDAEADKLLALVKQAGMGIFGGDDHSDYGAPEMGGSSEINTPGGIEVVGDHDGMMGLMKKLSSIQGPSADYEEEEGCSDCGHSPCGCNDEEEVSEARCNECGMMESKCGCKEEALAEEDPEELVREVQSVDQMTAEVAEDNAPDSGADNSTNDEKGNAAANAALAVADRKAAAPAGDDDLEESYTFESLYKKIVMLSEESTEEEDEKAEKAGKKVTKDIEYDDKKDKKEKVDEWANQVGKGPGKGTEASFEQDIDFMTKVISGGLNKPKSTGQTTVPVVASQLNRLTSHETTDINESVADWKTLAGIK